MHADRQQRIDAYVAQNRKSPGVALVAVLLLGPLGYLYVSAGSGLVAIVLAVLAGLLFWPLALVVWALCVVAAPSEAAAHNRKLLAQAELMAG